MDSTQLALAFSEVDAPLAHLQKTVPIDTTFPEEEANRLAIIESFNKHLFRPNTYLHKWWARRSGTTFRHILKQLVPDSLKRDYYNAGGLEGVTILDPMIGGGTTLHEAIRLGANVIGYDIDPIPILQARASLSSISVSEKEQVYRSFERDLAKRIAKYFKTSCPTCQTSADLQFTLYGLRKRYDNDEVLVVDSLVLREESDGTQRTLNEFYPSGQINLKGKTWRIMTREEVREKGINGKNFDLLSVPFPERYVPLVIAGHCPVHQNFYKSLDSQDIKLLQSAQRRSSKNIKLPSHDFEIPDGPKSDDLKNRNIHYFFELFFPRQLIYIVESQSILATIPQKHTLWMSLLLSTSLEFNAALCGYKGVDKRRPGAIRHVFSHHAYSFPYTALENNPLFPRNTSGTLGNLFETRIASAGQWAKTPVERYYTNHRWVKTAIQNEIDQGQETSSLSDFLGQKRMFLVSQQDSTQMPLPVRSVDYVVTDPPYFNSVQYSDLSYFFRCWLKTFIPTQANWHYVAQSSAVAESTENEGKFGLVLGQIWQECNRVLKRPHGRLIFTYHHWNPNAWAQLTKALKKARFLLTNAFVVHSENPISVHIMNLRALKHDTILVLKPRGPQKKAQYPKPEPIEDFDSYSFCKACGNMMGWILEQNLSDQEIAKTWTEFLKG
jgi:putative DNA methylase